MLISNTQGLPQPLVDAVTKDPYNKGQSDLTVTELIAPPRKVALEKAHDHEMVVDASDRLWSLMGQIGHGILERSANAGIVEKRWFSYMDGWVISGQTDLVLAEQKLLDYKFTSVYTARDGLKKEWEQQMNLLLWLAEANAQPIHEAHIVCLFRDWSVREARRDSGYPQKQVMVIPVPLWGYERAAEFCRERVRLHAIAQTGQLPECTTEERWERSPKWAVMKKGRKKAVRLYDNEPDAIKHAASEKQCTVEARPGESIRCESYCAAAPYCEQWKRISGISIDIAEQAEDGGGGVDLEIPVDQTMRAPAPAPPVSPPAAPQPPMQPGVKYDEFPVEQDVASSGGYRGSQVPLAPAPKVKPGVGPGPAAIAPPMPAEFVGRDAPVQVEETPLPPMPEVTEVPK